MFYGIIGLIALPEEVDEAGTVRCKCHLDRCIERKRLEAYGPNAG